MDKVPEKWPVCRASQARRWASIKERTVNIRVIGLLLSFAAFAAGCVTPKASEVPRNKEIVLRSEAELWSKGKLDVAAELYSPDFVCHFLVGPDWKGIEGIKQEVRSHRISFPDWNEKVDDIIAEGDRVVIRFTSTGTHLGTFQGLAPTGRKVSIREVAIYRLANGKIVEQWGQPDIFGLQQQLSESSAAAVQR
jgi:steroid delta-isomerase-like uncharacterized protein